MKTITIAAYNRPRNLRRLIRSLNRQTTTSGWGRVVVRIDGGGDKRAEVEREAMRLTALPTDVICVNQNVGINRNTYGAMAWAFDRLCADWNLYLEDDLELSPDALALCDWFIDSHEYIRSVYTDVVSLCLFNPRGCGDPCAVTASRRFTGWGFLMSRESWHNYARPAWFACEPAMWDNCLAKWIRNAGSGIVNIFPDLSRANNTGRTGEHSTPEKWRQMMDGFEWQQERREFGYRFGVGE